MQFFQASKLSPSTTSFLLGSVIDQERLLNIVVEQIKVYATLMHTDYNVSVAIARSDALRVIHLSTALHEMLSNQLCGGVILKTSVLDYLMSLLDDAKEFIKRIDNREV